jgi:hypothetical protein
MLESGDVFFIQDVTKARVLKLEQKVKKERKLKDTRHGL